MRSFSSRLIAWQKRHGRHDLPWQNTRDPYRIWLSEIMLQQTQVVAVIPYYQRFLQRFPTLRKLAAAPLDDVLASWSGLGYYSRARNLHAAAQLAVQRHGGKFPTNFDDVLALPGIGRSTAAAICVFAYGARQAILDGNVKRVLARCFGIRGDLTGRATEQMLWSRAEALLPQKSIEAYTQGLMDLGAGVCTRSKPRCAECPLHADCVALRDDLVSELPQKRRKRVSPQRATVMLVLRHGTEILLEKRPPSGIWGGLWSLPEIDCGDDAEAIALQRYGAATEAGTTMPVVEHGFTHFRLTITPQQLWVKKLLPRAAMPATQWFAPRQALAAGIPAPIRDIIISI